MSVSAMARETAEAPAVVDRMLAANRQAFGALASLFERRQPSHVITCARGSSDHAASYLKYLLEIHAGIPCCSIGASVVSIYGARLRLRDALLVSISQSGRSPDVIAFQADARRAGIPAVAITNDDSSPLALASDICLRLCAGPELSVAATKTFIASAAIAARLAAEWSGDRTLQAAVEDLPQVLERSLQIRWPTAEQALAAASSLYVLGRGPSLPMAQEAALKLKETSGIHAEGYSPAEVMHGPLELSRPGFPVLVFSPGDRSRPLALEAVEHLRTSGAMVFVAGPADGERDALACAPASHPHLDPVSMIATFYGSAERIARLRGRDPDRPRLLKKVTETR
ncbi:MAG: SIS domain-containing protein [Pseudomonadota bacterium]|nr:SIS domain-containing protein [Pseudomonadota bacterium]